MRFLFLLLVLMFSGCVPDHLTDFDFSSLQPPPPPEEAQGEALIGQSTAGDLRASLFAERGGAHLGYTRLVLRLTRAADGANVSSAAVSFRAHTAVAVGLPAIQPVYREDGYHGAAFLLSRDTTQTQSFRIVATVEEPGRSAIEIMFDVEARVDLWMQRSGDLLVSWVDPLRPTVGETPFEVAIHRWTGSAFEPVSNLGVVLYPYMDMGGGDGHSTPFRALATSTPGRYRWSVDFIMSGGWEMTVRMPDGPDALFATYTVHER